MVRTPISLEVTVGEDTIRGNITSIVMNDMDVEITQPEYGVSGGTHIPYFALSKHRLIEEGEVTPFAISRAKQIIVELYNSCRYVEENREKVKEEHQNYLDRRTELEKSPSTMTSERYKEMKSNLRRKLKSGEMDSKECQKELAIIRRSRADYDLQLSILKYDFEDSFEPHLSLDIATRMLNKLFA